ncbi:hypothetical protein Tco_0971558 [Tanacetum coccineum]
MLETENTNEDVQNVKCKSAGCNTMEIDQSKCNKVGKLTQKLRNVGRKGGSDWNRRETSGGCACYFDSQMYFPRTCQDSHRPGQDSLWPLRISSNAIWIDKCTRSIYGFDESGVHVDPAQGEADQELSAPKSSSTEVMSCIDAREKSSRYLLQMAGDSMDLKYLATTPETAGQKRKDYPNIEKDMHRAMCDLIFYQASIKGRSVRKACMDEKSVMSRRFVFGVRLGTALNSQAGIVQRNHGKIVQNRIGIETAEVRPEELSDYEESRRSLMCGYGYAQ